MIYSYIAAFLSLGIFCLVYGKLIKPFLPKEVTDKVTAHKGKMLFVVILVIVLSLGSPFRLESTSMTGKTNFATAPTSIEAKREGTPDPINQDITKQGELIKQQRQEIEDEINNDEPK